jgi:hypothetical protein
MQMPSLLETKACFVAGSAKSGTTLLVALLDGHPDLLPFPEETAYFPTARVRFPDDPAGQAAYLVDAAESALLFATEPKPGRRDYAGFPRRAFRERFLAAVGGGRDGNVLTTLIASYAEIVGRTPDSFTRWIEKTPANRRCLGAIRECYPQAKILLTLRDPRGVLAAYLQRWRRNKGGHRSFYLCARNWLESARVALSPPPNTCVVRFEELVTRPTETLRDLCGFLGIPFSESLLTPTKHGSQWVGNSGGTERFLGIDSSPATRWKAVLTPDEAAFIEVFAGSWMNALDYHAGARPWSAAMRRFPEESTFVRDRWKALRDVLGGHWRMPSSAILAGQSRDHVG